MKILLGNFIPEVKSAMDNQLGLTCYTEPLPNQFSTAYLPGSTGPFGSYLSINK
jgi:hypothetical protein